MGVGGGRKRQTFGFVIFENVAIIKHGMGVEARLQRTEK